MITMILKRFCLRKTFTREYYKLAEIYKILCTIKFHEELLDMDVKPLVYHPSSSGHIRVAGYTFDENIKYCIMPLFCSEGATTAHKLLTFKVDLLQKIWKRLQEYSPCKGSLRIYCKYHIIEFNFATIFRLMIESEHKRSSQIIHLK